MRDDGASDGPEVRMAAVLEEGCRKEEGWQDKGRHASSLLPGQMPVCTSFLGETVCLAGTAPGRQSRHHDGQRPQQSWAPVRDT